MSSEPLLLKVPEAAKLLRLGRNRIYELVAERRLHALRFGRSILIPHESLVRFIANEAEKQGRGRG